MHHLLFTEYKVSVAFWVLKTHTHALCFTHNAIYVELIHYKIALTIIPECC
jgi:hypothetical protein